MVGLEQLGNDCPEQTKKKKGQIVSQLVAYVKLVDEKRDLYLEHKINIKLNF